MRYIVNNKWLYYLIQFTWGLLMNIIGLMVFAFLIIFRKKKPKKFRNCWYIAVGKNWGGLEFGTFFLIDEHEHLSTKYHEAGHGLQNIIWGTLYLFVIFIPSSIRYWYREHFYYRKGKTPKTYYDDIWFEGQATNWGYKYYGSR